MHPSIPSLTNVRTVRSATRELLNAQERMLSRWAEGDDAVKQELWRNLHQKGDQLRGALEA